MGYETDTYTLIAAGTVLTPVAAPGAVVTTAAALGGSDFVRAVVRVNVTAVSAPTISDWGGFFQNQDAGGTWYPLLANRTEAPGYTQFGVAAPAANTQWEINLNAFPGNNFRFCVYAVGTAGTITITATGDFQKWVADST